MKLSSLNPAIIGTDSERVLVMDCPHCGIHRIGIVIVGEARAIWGKSDFDGLTLKTDEPLKSCGLPFGIERGAVTV